MSSFLKEANWNEENEQSDDEIQRRSPFITIEKKRVQSWVFNKRHFNLRSIIHLNYCEKSDCEDFTDGDESNCTTENHKMYSRKENCNSKKGNSTSRKMTKKAQKSTQFKKPFVYKNKKTVGKLVQNKKASLRSYKMLGKHDSDYQKNVRTEKTKASPRKPSEIASNGSETQQKVMITFPIKLLKDCVSKNEMSGSEISNKVPDIEEVQKKMSILFGEEFETTTYEEENSVESPASSPSNYFFHLIFVFNTMLSFTVSEYS